ncbi:hypothetical protein FBR04_19200 [Betaproteobacteria bacterium PRO7]|nr:hypothetical protein [Betaproteobacteria bacterium PRO7]
MATTKKDPNRPVKVLIAEACLVPAEGGGMRHAEIGEEVTLPDSDARPVLGRRLYYLNAEDDFTGDKRLTATEKVRERIASAAKQVAAGRALREDNARRIAAPAPTMEELAQTIAATVASAIAGAMKK